MEINTFYKLRTRWFGFMAKAFITRYFMGVFILVIFLPGVAIGDNFSLFISSITKPFVIISQTDSPLLAKLVWLLLLISVFVVWSQAQKRAIKGGDFSEFQESLPISETLKNKLNIRMLLVANHFLWPFIIASYFYFPAEGDSPILMLFLRHSFLILLLLVIQYVLLFKNSIKNIGGVVALALLLIVPVDFNLEFIRLALCFILMFVFVFHFLLIDNHQPKKFYKLRNLIPAFFTKNLHLQTLFKSGLTSSLFRISIIVSLMVGFTFVIDYWVEDYTELTPYYLVLEAFLAYLMSGFYVSFLDQRNSMRNWLITLPVKNYYWVIRDVFTLIVLTAILHGLFYLWAAQLTEFNTMLAVFCYHIILLIISYPLRVLLTEKQTFITFVVLFIITAITLFNLS